MTANLLRHQLPPFPIVLGQPVLNGQDGVFIHPTRIVINHLNGGERLAFTPEMVFAIFEKLGGSRVQSQVDIASGLIAGIDNGLDDDFYGLFVAFETGRETSAPQRSASENFSAP